MPVSHIALRPDNILHTLLRASPLFKPRQCCRAQSLFSPDSGAMNDRVQPQSIWLSNQTPSLMTRWRPPRPRLDLYVGWNEEKLRDVWPSSIIVNFFQNLLTNFEAACELHARKQTKYNQLKQDMAFDVWQEKLGSHHQLLGPEGSFIFDSSSWFDTVSTTTPSSQESPAGIQDLRTFRHSDNLWTQNRNSIMPELAVLASPGNSSSSVTALRVALLLQHIVLNITAKQATYAVLSELRSRAKSFNADSLFEIYQEAFGLMRAHDCRRLLVRWAAVMGKRKHERYSEKPGWWPETVAHIEVNCLKSHGKSLWLHVTIY